MWIPSDLNTDITLYVAIADAIEMGIKQRELKPGDKMPTQRQIAEIIGVNLTTVTRAYNLCKKRGLLEAVTGRGTFVSDPEDQFLPRIQNETEELIDFGLVGALKGDTQAIEEIIRYLPEKGRLSELLDYIPSEGLMRHRQSGAKWMGYHGYEVSSEDVVICSGSMHAINCTLTSMFGYQATIIVDQFTFTGFRNACNLNDIHLIPIGFDEEGMLPDDLRQTCEKQKVDGIYLMPKLQNPTAISMSQQRKETIAEIIKAYDLLLIEDDIYNLMDDDNHPIAPMVPDQSIYICGTSKTLYAGLRIAYVVVPKHLQAKFVQSITTTIWMASPMSSEIISQLIDQDIVMSIMASKRKTIKERLSLVHHILKDYDVRSTEYSPFVWLYLPNHIDATAFEHRALLSKVRVVSSHKFAVGPHSINAVRLSVVNIEHIETMRRGLFKLVELLKNPEWDVEQIM